MLTQIFNVVVARQAGRCFVVGMYDAEHCEKFPTDWDSAKAIAFSRYGGENVIITTIKMRSGWMEQLFIKKTENADVKSDHSVIKIDKCAICPMKIYNLGSYYCSHNGNLFPQREIEKLLETPPWCPLHSSGLIIERAAK